MGIRVGEAVVPGPASITQTQPNGANHFVSETRGGGGAELREAHSDVPLCMLQHIEERSRERTHRHAIPILLYNRTDDLDTASDDTRRDPSHAPLGWKFCTMNMTAFSTQHLAIFELGYGSRTGLGPRGHE